MSKQGDSGICRDTDGIWEHGESQEGRVGRVLGKSWMDLKQGSDMGRSGF